MAEEHNGSGRPAADSDPPPPPPPGPPPPPRQTPASWVPPPSQGIDVPAAAAAAPASFPPALPPAWMAPHVRAVATPSLASSTVSTPPRPPSAASASATATPPATLGALIQAARPTGASGSPNAGHNTIGNQDKEKTGGTFAEKYEGDSGESSGEKDDLSLQASPFVSSSASVPEPPSCSPPLTGQAVIDRSASPGTFESHMAIRVEVSRSPHSGVMPGALMGSPPSGSELMPSPPAAGVYRYATPTASTAGMANGSPLPQTDETNANTTDTAGIPSASPLPQPLPGSSATSWRRLLFSSPSPPAAPTDQAHLLQVLDWSGRGLKFAGVEGGWALYPTIHTLILRENELSTLVKQGLESMANLRTLDLRRNKLSSLGETLLVLSQCRNLKHLYLHQSTKDSHTSNIQEYTSFVFRSLRGLESCDDVSSTECIRLNPLDQSAFEFVHLLSGGMSENQLLRCDLSDRNLPPNLFFFLLSALYQLKVAWLKLDGNNSWATLNSYSNCVIFYLGKYLLYLDEEEVTPQRVHLALKAQAESKVKMEKVAWEEWWQEALEAAREHVERVEREEAEREARAASIARLEERQKQVVEQYVASGALVSFANQSKPSTETDAAVKSSDKSSKKFSKNKNDPHLGEEGDHGYHVHVPGRMAMGGGVGGGGFAVTGANTISSHSSNIGINSQLSQKIEILLHYLQVWGLVLLSALHLDFEWPAVFTQFSTWVRLFTLNLEEWMSWTRPLQDQVLFFVASFWPLILLLLFWRISKLRSGLDNWVTKYVTHWKRTRRNAFLVFFGFIVVELVVSFLFLGAPVYDGASPNGSNYGAAILLTLVPTAILLLWYFFVHRFRRTWLTDESTDKDEFRALWLGRINNLQWLLLFLVTNTFMPVARVILKQFQCSCVRTVTIEKILHGGGVVDYNRLPGVGNGFPGLDHTHTCFATIDPSQKCFPLHVSATQVVALICGLIYLIGIPLFYYNLIRHTVALVLSTSRQYKLLDMEIKRIKSMQRTERKTHKEELKEYQRIQNKLYYNIVNNPLNSVPASSLFAAYQHRYQYTKLYQMLQKLLLVSVTLFVPDSMGALAVGAQVLVAAILIVAYLSLLLVARPYNDPLDDFMDILAEAGNTTSILVALSLVHNAPWLDRGTADILLYVANGVILLAFVLAFVVSPARTYLRRRRTRLQRKKEEAEEARRVAEIMSGVESFKQKRALNATDKAGSALLTKSLDRISLDGKPSTLGLAEALARAQNDKGKQDELAAVAPVSFRADGKPVVRLYEDDEEEEPCAVVPYPKRSSLSGDLSLAKDADDTGAFSPTSGEPRLLSPIQRGGRHSIKDQTYTLPGIGEKINEEEEEEEEHEEGMHQVGPQAQHGRTLSASLHAAMAHMRDTLTSPDLPAAPVLEFNRSGMVYGSTLSSRTGASPFSTSVTPASLAPSHPLGYTLPLPLPRPVQPRKGHGHRHSASMEMQRLASHSFGGGMGLERCATLSATQGGISHTLPQSSPFFPLGGRASTATLPPTRSSLTGRPSRTGRHIVQPSIHSLEVLFSATSPPRHLLQGDGANLFGYDQEEQENIFPPTGMRVVKEEQPPPKEQRGGATNWSVAVDGPAAAQPRHSDASLPHPAPPPPAVAPSAEQELEEEISRSLADPQRQQQLAMLKLCTPSPSNSTRRSRVSFADEHSLAAPIHSGLRSPLSRGGMLSPHRSPPSHMGARYSTPFVSIQEMGEQGQQAQAAQLEWEPAAHRQSHRRSSATRSISNVKSRSGILAGFGSVSAARSHSTLRNVHVQFASSSQLDVSEPRGGHVSRHPRHPSHPSISHIDVSITDEAAAPVVVTPTAAAVLERLERNAAMAEWEQQGMSRADMGASPSLSFYNASPSPQPRRSMLIEASSPNGVRPPAPVSVPPPLPPRPSHLSEDWMVEQGGSGEVRLSVFSPAVPPPRKRGSVLDSMLPVVSPAPAPAPAPLTRPSLGSMSTVRLEPPDASSGRQSILSAPSIQPQRPSSAQPPVQIQCSQPAGGIGTRGHARSISLDIPPPPPPPMEQDNATEDLEVQVLANQASQRRLPPPLPPHMR